MRLARSGSILATSWFLATGGLPAAGAAGEPAEILIAAAASLAPYCQAMGQRFEAMSPGVRVRFTFASSGHLRQQIEAGAPADGFISASTRQMDFLERKGLIKPDTRLPLAQNSLALIVNARNPPAVRTFSGLSSPGVVSIAMGNPSYVPAGYYARAALKSLGLWEAVQPKLVYGIDDRQTLAYVMRDEVGVGLAYLSDAHISGEEVRVVAVAPEGSHPRIIYPMAVLRDAAHSRQTKNFFAFLSSSEGQQALRDFELQPFRSEPSKEQGARQ